MIKRILGLLILMTIIFIVPFVAFGSDHKNDYEKVVRDASLYFGIENYQIQFLDGKFLSANNNQVQGSIRQEYDGDKNKDYIITIHRSMSRPMVIATIFHEFAHAAQEEYKYSIDFKGYTKEQHAEILAFQAMWSSNKYWWNAVHMLTMHTMPFKPTDYRTPKTLWKTFGTGQNVLKFTPRS